MFRPALRVSKTLVVLCLLGLWAAGGFWAAAVAATDGNTVQQDKAAAVAPAQAVVAIVKGQDANIMVAQAIELLGGLKDIVADGKTVVIKPNLTAYKNHNTNDPNMKWVNQNNGRIFDDSNLTYSNYYQYCILKGICTDVGVTRALVNCINQAARCKLTIAEGAGGPVERMFRVCGYDELAREKGLGLVDLATDTRRPVKVDGMGYKEYAMPATTMDCDVLIDVGILKTHGLCGITGGMKNFYGLLPNDDKVKRSDFHSKADEVLCDLMQIRKPDLTIIDGTIGMEGAGPIWGSPVKMDLIIAGRDVVAVDTVCAAVMGHDSNRILHLVYAARKGLGVTDLSKITIKGASIAEVRRPFVMARTSTGVSRPKTDENMQKIRALADNKPNVEYNDRGVTRFHAFFKPERLKVDKEKYPLRTSYGFSIYTSSDSNTLGFSADYETIYRELAPVVRDELNAWIRENIESPSTQPAAATQQAAGSRQ